MFSAKFFKDAGERAVWTFAQSLLALVTVGTAITEIDWLGALGIAATATVASLLKSVVATGVGDSDSAATLPAEPVADEEFYR